MILGISGYARSGKDEFAKILVEDFGYKRIAFADKLREVLLAIDPIVWQFNRTAITGEGFRQVYRVSDIINAYGWDGYKETTYSDEIRGLLQRLGTEAGRKLLGDNIWIDAAINNQYGNIVIPDCRFINEANEIKNRGGKIIRIVRPGIGPANNHISETSLDSFGFDYIIENNGTLEDFKEKVHDLMEELNG